MTDYYAVIGNPVAHSLSPQIHHLFAEQTQQDMQYNAILAAIDDFKSCIIQLQNTGLKGANITLPFKEQAYQLAQAHSERATIAQAVNTLRFENNIIYGDNTDGIGLLRDLKQNFQQPILNQRILIIGAGGAARGIIPVLLQEKPAQLTIVNRTASKAIALANDFSALGAIDAVNWDDHKQAYDLIINATSLSLTGDSSPFPACQLNAGGGCYDLAYDKQPNKFLTWGKSLHAAWTTDGLGMLIEQAAEAFFIWRNIRPETQGIRQKLFTL